MNKLKKRIPLLLALSSLAVAWSTATAQDVYWTVNGASIMGSDLDGQNVVEVFDGSGMTGTAVDVAVTDTHIYWTEKNDTAAGGIWRANRDGSGAELFVTNPTSTIWAPQFIAVDEANDKLYFSDWYLGLFSADLSTGENVVSLGQPNGGTGSTGIAVRSDTELLSVTGTSESTIYSTDLTTGVHSVADTHWGGGSNHELAYDAATDTVYFAEFGTSGGLLSHTFGGAGTQWLLSGLQEPLGVALSASKTHVLYVERSSLNRISAYDLTNSDNSFELVSNQGAFFGVAIAGDPVMPPEVPPLELPLVETFENGTPGSSIVDQPTSDGQAMWGLTVESPGASAHYGGETGAVTYEPYTDSQRADVYLNADVNDVEEFIIKFDDILLRGGRGDINGTHNLSTFVALGARKTDGSDFGTYHFRQWHSTNTEEGTYTFLYGIHYVDPAGVNHVSPGNLTAQTVPLSEVDGGDYSGSELLLTGLELHVRGNEQRLLLNGSPVGAGEWFPTQGSYGDGVPDRALAINAHATPEAETLTNPVFHGISIEPPPEPGVPPFKRLYVYDGFDYPEGDLVGQDGGTGWAEPWTQSMEGTPPEARPIAQVVAPGQTYGDLEVTGNKAEMANARRAFRYIDVEGLYTGEEEMEPTDSIGWPGSSVWMSFIAEGAAAETDPFWGIALFKNDTEKLFFGKPSSRGPLRLSAQSGVQEFDGAISINDKHLIVIRIDFDPENGDSATLFLNPDPMGRTPSDDEALGVYTGPNFEMSFNRVRFANGDGPGGTIDELRMGATWADVTPVPYDGFVNGDLEQEPLARGWSFVRNIQEHPGIIPGSTKAVFIPSDKTSGQYPLLSQHSPNWIDFSDTIPFTDPVTNQPTATLLQPTGPEWQVGFHAAVADAGAAGNRSLNLGIGNERPEGYDKGPPAINFRITGTGGGQAYNGGPGISGSGWVDVFPEGTFAPSVHTDDVFTDPTVYYIQFDGDYTTASPSYVISVRRADEGDFFAVSDPVSAFQHVVPAAGSGIVTVRFNGFVEAPYVVDDIHMMTTGDSAPDGFATWQELHFETETDPAVIGPDADADGDGIPNLLEYAFGMDPNEASRAGMPTQSVQEIGGEQYLTLTITRPVGLTDLDYEVSESEDLATWTSTAVAVGSPSDNGDGTETVTYRSSKSVSSTSRIFLEVRVNRWEAS